MTHSHGDGESTGEWEETTQHLKSSAQNWCTDPSTHILLAHACHKWGREISSAHSSGGTAQSPDHVHWVYSDTGMKRRIGSGGLVFIRCALLILTSTQTGWSVVVQRYPVFNYFWAFVHAFPSASNAILIPFPYLNIEHLSRSNSNFDLLCKAFLYHLGPQWLLPLGKPIELGLFWMYAVSCIAPSINTCIFICPLIFSMW